jgi:hypothetical protein
MRQVVSVSFPEKEAQNIKKVAKRRNITVSSYFLSLHKMAEEEMITEDDILKMRDKALAEHKAGKTILIESLSELI